MSRDHSVHRFTRLLSTSSSGSALYGCEYARCPDTEVRQKGSPSPFTVRRHQAAERRQQREGSRP